jgi:hypothetical protein
LDLVVGIGPNFGVAPSAPAHHFDCVALTASESYAWFKIDGSSLQSRRVPVPTIFSANTPNREIGPDGFNKSFTIPDVYEGYENEPSVILMEWTLNESNDDARSVCRDEFLPSEFKLFLTRNPKVVGGFPETICEQNQKNVKTANNQSVSLAAQNSLLPS